MKRIVLIVDDNPGCAEPLLIALEVVSGIEVQVAADARSALLMLANGRERMGAVITDLRMPQMDGMELLQMLKNDDALCHVPVLVISGDSDPALPGRAISGGAAGYFVKPYSPAAVRKRLEQLLA